MQKITIFALVAALALVSAALVGVGFAQLTTPNPTAPQQNVAPWCINGDPQVAAPYCVNDTVAGNWAGPGAQNGYGYGGQGCHGYGAQGTGQGWFGGMMGGRGMMGRGW